MRIYQYVGNFTEPENMSKNITDIAPLVSIIVPIYNVEQYVNRCVDSILAQTYSNIEVILIDDGSTDKSRERISVYNNDPRCKVVYKDNGGASSARNVGISLASGEYIYFIDADDYIVESAIELLVDTMTRTRADFCCYRVAFFSENNAFVSGRNFDSDIIDSKTAIIEDAFLSRNIKISPCSKFFSASFLKNNRLRFYEGIINEDSLFTMLCAIYANKVAFQNTILYYAYQRPCSVSRNLKQESITSYFIIYSEIYNALQNLNILNKYVKYLYAGITKQILYTLVQCGYRSASYSSFYSLYVILRGSLYMDRAKSKYIIFAGIRFRAIYELSFFPRIFYVLAKSLKILGYNIA